MPDDLSMPRTGSRVGRHCRYVQMCAKAKKTKE